MTGKITFRSLVLLGAGCLALSACSSTGKKAAQQLPPDPGAGVATSTNTNTGTLQGPLPGTQSDFLIATAGADTIYFDTDQYNIDTIDAAALQSQAQWLRRYPGKRATIEGHCDERGTRDYNLALGERRANAAKNYLVGLGVDAARLSTISYGKERPAALGSNEEAWSKNRRAVSVTID